MTPPSGKVRRGFACVAAFFLAGIQPASAAVQVYHRMDEDTFRLHYVPKKGEVVQKPLLCEADGGPATSSAVVPLVHPGEDHTASGTSFLASRENAATASRGSRECSVACLEGYARYWLGRLCVGGPQMELQTYMNDGAPKETPIKKPIDGENGLYAFATPEPFLTAGGSEQVGTEAYMKASAERYFPDDDGTAALRDPSIARHTVELGNASQKQKFVMHWWGKSDKNLRAGRTGGPSLTRFVDRRPTPELRGISFVDAKPRWIGKHLSADRIPVTVPEVGDRGGGEEFKSLAEIREAKCDVETGLHRLNENALQKQMEVMQKAVTQNFQKADGAALQPEEVELTLWWSTRRNVDGLWLVGTLKELKEAVEDSLRSEEQEYVKALHMDTNRDNTPVEVYFQYADDALGGPYTGATISFRQAQRDGKFHTESRAYSEIDATRYVLYSAGTGKEKNLTLMSYEKFAAEKTLLHKTEPTEEKMPSSAEARGSW